MNKTIIAIIAVFFTFSFYSFLFSGSKDAAKKVEDKVQVTSVDAVCKQQKELCEEL